MCVKMKNLRIVLSVLCVVLVAKCEEPHHIEERILENQDTSKNVLNNTDDQILSSLQNENTSLESNQPSSLEQVSSDVIQTIHLENSVLSADDVAPTPVNVSSLLRTNSSEVNEASKASELNDNKTHKKLEIDVSPNENTKVQPLISDSEQNCTNAKTKNEALVDTEVKDLLRENSEPKQDVLVENHQHPFEPEEPIQIPDKIDKQTELIDDGENTEDELRRHRVEDAIDSAQGPIAMILVSAFVALSVLCYAGLLAWRKYLENRYGSRTLLVDGEELADPDDLRHFSI